MSSSQIFRTPRMQIFFVKVENSSMFELPNPQNMVEG